jgi:hypothetical protein
VRIGTTRCDPRAVPCLSQSDRLRGHAYHAGVTSQLYVVGGQQRAPRPMKALVQDWYEYQKGLVLAVDADACSARLAVEYVTPPELCASGDPAILFKSGTLEGRLLYLCTQTEVLVYEVPSFALRHHVSLPQFNDVHHVRPAPDGNLLIANTGLDMVMEITLDGSVVREWSALGMDPWERFSRDVDYRKVRTTKPHLAHPNFIFLFGGDIWATRFEQKDAVCLTEPARRIEIGVERLHDGVVHNGLVYFTTVNGKVVVADPVELRVVKVIDLNRDGDPEALLGWCRGIFVDEDRLWVGFSRMRPTKFRENVAWVRHGFKHSLGTRVSAYDLATGRLLTEVDLEPFGLSAVFGIFPAHDAPRTPNPLAA